MSQSFNRIFLVLSLVVAGWFFVDYGAGSYPFYGDSMGYYMYLPSTFIYHNHKALDWLPADKQYDHTVKAYIEHLRHDALWTPKGYIINKYTYGVAALELPFFLGAHVYEKATGGEASGYSATYRYMLKVSSLFYALLGLFLLYHALKIFFPGNIALAVTLLVFTGTNLFWFTLYQAGMAHVPLFFLYALLVYTTVLLHRQPRTLLFVIAGIAAGLITVIRPTDIICLLVPALYNVHSVPTLKEKAHFVSRHRRKVLLFAVAFVLPLVPQMLYWKKFAGSFLYYSYKGETFTWLQPHILDGLFSFSNGWLVYTPLMALALAGLVLYRRFKAMALTMAIVVPCYVYIVYSWHCYNYINGLGSRPMIHLYPLLAIPLAAVVERITYAKLWIRAALVTLIALCVALNLSYSLQEERGILLSEESNGTYNVHMLFKMNANYADMVTYDVQQVQPDERRLHKVTTIACQDYEDSLTSHFTRDTTGRSRYVYYMSGDQEYHPGTLNTTYHAAIFKDAKWLKCSGRFLCTEQYQYHKHLLTLEFIDQGKIVNWSGCKIDNKIGLTEPGATHFVLGHSQLNHWGYVYFFVKIPPGIQEGTAIRADVWNVGKQPLYIDDICLEAYSE